MPDVLLAAEPRGQRRPDQKPQHAQKPRHHKCRGKPVADDVAGVLLAPAADVVRHLHGKSGRNGVGHAAEKPCAGGDESDGGRGVRAQRTDHCGVDILHHDRGDLCQNRGQTQVPYLFDLRSELPPVLIAHPNPPSAVCRLIMPRM